MSMDFAKPLVVPAGADALGQIGVPPLPQGELAHISVKLVYEDCVFQLYILYIIHQRNLRGSISYTITVVRAVSCKSSVCFTH